MDLTPFVDQLRRDLLAAADAGGEEARALAERLTAPLESSVRLALLSALSQAAEEITGQLAPGAVDVRLRGSDLGFAVTHPPAEPAAGPAADAAAPSAARRRRSTRAARSASRCGCPSSSSPASTRPPRASASRSTPGSSGPSPTPWSPGPRPSSDTRRGRWSGGSAVHRLGALAAPPRTRTADPGRPARGHPPCPEEGAAMPTFDTPGPITARIEVVSGVGPGPRRRPARHRRHRPPAQRARAPPTSPPPSRPWSPSPPASCSSGRPAGRGCSSSAPARRSRSTSSCPTGSSVDVRTTAGDITCAGRLGAVGPGEQARRPAPRPGRQPARPHLQRRHLRRRRRRRDRGDHLLRRRPRRRDRRPRPAGAPATATSPSTGPWTR